MSKKEAGMMLSAFTDTLTDCLKKGNAVPLPGLGTFQVGKRAKREGRNPQTGAKMIIPAKKGSTIQSRKSIERCSDVDTTFRYHTIKPPQAGVLLCKKQERGFLQKRKKSKNDNKKKNYKLGEFVPYYGTYI